MYSAKLLDHFHNPRHAGEIENATAVIEVSNPACGDVMKLWVVVRDGRIAEVKFKVAGCVPAVASVHGWPSGLTVRPLPISLPGPPPKSNLRWTAFPRPRNMPRSSRPMR